MLTLVQQHSQQRKHYSSSTCDCRHVSCGTYSAHLAPQTASNYFSITTLYLVMNSWSGFLHSLIGLVLQQVESARKLRWYDREDLRPLVEANLKDKQLLHETIAALRQVQVILITEHAHDESVICIQC